jgi:hypothetical protein
VPTSGHCKLPRIAESISFQPITTEVIEKYIDNLKNKNNKTFDGLSSIILKKFKIHLSAIVAKIINKSLESATVPEPLKISRITPVYKGGTKTSCNN